MLIGEEAHLRVFYISTNECHGQVQFIDCCIQYMWDLHDKIIMRYINCNENSNIPANHPIISRVGGCQLESEHFIAKMSHLQALTEPQQNASSHIHHHYNIDTN